MSNAFAAPHFSNDDAARAMIEGIRWPSGPVCSHCGTINHAYAVKGRAGLYRCAEKECRKDFSVTTGTVMERSKIALHKWMMGFYLMCASKKGVSAHQLHRALGLTYQSAWFMAHRIREAMRDGGFSPLGGNGSIVEADETYFGSTDERRESPQRKGRPYTKAGKTGPGGKRAIVALVERGGNVRTFHVAVADKVHCVAQSRGDLNSTLKAMFRVRGETSRINIAEALGQQQYDEFGLQTEFREAVSAMRYCLKIRNRFTHSYWHSPLDGLCYVALEDLAETAEIVTDLSKLDFFYLDIELITRHLAYFRYTDDALRFANYEGRVRAGKLQSHIVSRPKQLERPPLYTRKRAHDAP